MCVCDVCRIAVLLSLYVPDFLMNACVFISYIHITLMNILIQ